MQRGSTAALVVLVSACYTAHATEPGRPRASHTSPAAASSALPPIGATVPAAAPATTAAPPAAPATTAAVQPAAACPTDMALVQRAQGAFCIDRWEASLELVRPGGERVPWPGNRSIDGREADFVAVSAPGRMPQGYVSGNQAERACINAGKRLCQIDEWTRACRGSSGLKYPYGNERLGGACNDRFRTLEAHPVVRLFDRSAPKGMSRASIWEPYFMNDPRLHELDRTVERTGARRDCVSEAGAYDLVGNLHEWVADEAGTFVGGFFMDTFQNGEGCEYRTTAHRRDYHDYSTGFRCCRDTGVPRAPAR